MGVNVIIENASDVKFLFRRSAARQEELRKLYDRLMERARGRKYQKGVHERHHIVPRALGGDDRKENIAVLTYAEHFLAHYILAVTTEGQERYRMLFAVWQMTWSGESHEQRKVTARQYALARVAHVEARSLPEQCAKVKEGHARRRTEMGEDAWKAWNANQGLKTSFNRAVLKAEMGEDAWKALYAARGVSIAAGLARRKAEMSTEEWSAWCAEHGTKTAAGLARRKAEMSTEEWSAWCERQGAISSINNARRKAEMSEDEYAVYCAENGKKSAAGLSRRRAEMGETEWAVWQTDRETKAAAGRARRRAEMGETEWMAAQRDNQAKSVVSKLKKIPLVRCLNDGTIHQHAVAAAKVYGVRSDSIHKVCQGKCKTTGGLRFEYVTKGGVE